MGPQQPGFPGQGGGGGFGQPPVNPVDFGFNLFGPGFGGKGGGGGGTGGLAPGSNIDLLLDIPLQVTVELGRTTMAIKEILEIGIGSVIELKKLAGEPVDMFVNNKLIAKGEVVVIDENFSIRITSIVSPEERLESSLS
jgi:flagellar motor switch protein FliN